MKRAALILALSLAACSKGGDPTGEAAATPGGAKQAAEDTLIPCALARARDFKPDCTREIARGPDGEVWVIHHPDGGFRRFVLIDKGTRIATADGAEEVRARRVGSELEVRVGPDGYRFPVAPEVAASSHAARP